MEGWRCQEAGASAGEIRPAAWLSGRAAAQGLAHESRCSALQTEARHKHLCPPPLLTPIPLLARRQDSQMLAKLQRTPHSSSLSLKSDQNNHR